MAEQVLIRGRPMLSPAGERLQVATRALAEAISAEWADTLERTPQAMARRPLTVLAFTQIDRIIPQRSAIIEVLCAYLVHDPAGYREPTQPDLRARQEALLSPVLRWADRRFGLLIVPIDDLEPLAPDPAGRQALALWLEGLDAERLTALQAATAALGSLLIAAALMEGEIATPEEACAAALVEEIFQAEHWGSDADAEARRAGILADVEAALRYVRLASG